MNIADEFNLDEDDFTWQSLAMCAGVKPGYFFEESESNEYIDASVRSICSYCPVEEICNQNGKKNKNYGIWGGERLSGGKVVD